MLKLHANNASKETLRSEAAPDPTSVLDEAQTQPKKARPPAKMTNRQARRKQATLDKAAAFVRSKTARDAGDVRVEKDQKPISRPSLSNPLEDGDAIESIQESKSDDGSNGADVPKRPVAPTHSVPKDDTVSASDIGAAASQSKPAGPEGRAETGSNSTGMRKSPIQEPGKSVNKKLLSEKERKAELAGKLRPFIRTIEKRPLTRLIVYEKSESKSKPKKPSSQLSDVPEFSSLQGAIGRKSSKIQAVIERVDATKLEIQRKITVLIIRDVLTMCSAQSRSASSAGPSIRLRESLVQVRKNPFNPLVPWLIPFQPWCLPTSGPKISSL